MSDPDSRKQNIEEARFSKRVIGFFRNRITIEELDNVIVVDEKLKVLKDLTIGKDREGTWRLIAGFQQQDIVFYNPKQSLPMKDFKSGVLRIDKYDKTEQKPVVIPYAICELKIGSRTNTHSLITYASISAQLKSIFPHCAYYLMMDSNIERGMKPETLLRHTKGFDRVFLNWNSEKNKAWDTIRAHIDYLREKHLLS